MPKENSDKKYFGLKLTDDQLGWLQAESDRQGETQSTVVRNLIRKAMESQPIIPQGSTVTQQAVS